MARTYVPESGDIVWLEFDPQAGHEESGHRPAVVLSPTSYNSRTQLMLCCPTTTRIKGYPFEVSIAGQPPSVALADQVRSVYWFARHARRKGRASNGELLEKRAKITRLLG